MPEIEFDSEVEKIGWFSWVATVYEFVEWPSDDGSSFSVKTPICLGIFFTRGRAMRAIEEYLRGVN